jgi:hypothetical protein
LADKAQGSNEAPPVQYFKTGHLRWQRSAKVESSDVLVDESKQADIENLRGALCPGDGQSLGEFFDDVVNGRDRDEVSFGGELAAVFNNADGSLQPSRPTTSSTHFRCSGNTWHLRQLAP